MTLTIRKMSRIIMLLLCTCMAFVPMHAQEIADSVSRHQPTACVPVMSVAKDSLVFKGGERLEFALKYKWGAIDAEVGIATVKLDELIFNGVEAYRLTAYGRTVRFFDKIFKVREDFKSWFTRDGMRPLKFTRDTHEGGYVAKNVYLYDWSADEPLIRADVYSSSRGQRSIELPLTPCTFDLPALFYFARNMDFDVVEPGKKHPMTFAIDDDVYNVYFILHGRQTMNVKGIGEVKVIKFGAKLLEGEVFKGEEDMIIYVTDDMNRLPVYFEAPLLVGRASGRLTGWEGLKSPFSSIIKAETTAERKRK